MNKNKHYKQTFHTFLKADNALKYFAECFEIFY